MLWEGPERSGGGLGMFLPAVRADTFQEIINGLNFKSFRNRNRRNRCIFEAVSAMTLFAVEMDMDVVVLVIMMTVSELVADPVAGVVEHMHEMRLAEGL